MALFIGLMSGTSMDAVDAALLNFQDNSIDIVATHSTPIDTTLKQTLQTLCEHPSCCSLQQIGETDIEIARLFADTTLALINKTATQAKDITAIGSHGQTLFHSPNSNTPFTIQLGDPNTIAEITGITTVADFRRRDMAAGGQGAPLVPAFHQAVFQSTASDSVIVNIGGIANITILPADPEQAVSGFDTGPGNALLDAWTLHHLKHAMDKDAHWAKQGQLQTKLLQRFLDAPYFSSPPPKSTGKEDFNYHWITERVNGESAADVQHTLVQLSAETIASAIETEAPNTQEIYLCGGGTHNPLLVDKLNHRLSNIQIQTTSALGIHPDWVEAAAFAWLAKQCLEGKPANLPKVTGAKHPVTLGAIYPAS